MRTRMIRAAAAAAMVGASLALAACEQVGVDSAPEAPAAPEAQYQTQAGHFRELQTAGLTGDYQRFAGHLKAEQPATIIAELTRSFGGQPFDVYTWKAEETPTGLSRLVELRGPSGRLYLFVRLDRVPGGWRVASYDLSRDRTAVTARL